MNSRSEAVDYQSPLLRQSRERSAQWWLVGQGGSVYRFDHPARSRHLPSRIFYAAGLVVLVLVAGFMLFSALYIRDWLQSLFLLLALTG
jgi:hypothetical protein